jgi:ubiquinone/menaquinone biosynthesis C-methylase UbiE
MDQETTQNPAETYHAYLGPALFVPCADQVLAAAAPRRGERAVDVACGTGILTHRLAPRLGPEGRITGVDFSPDMLAVARRQPAAEGAPVEWREATADSLPVAGGAVDLVVCQQGFQFFPDRGAAAREMSRVLNTGGRAVIAVWRSLEHHTVFRALMEAEADHLGVSLDRLTVPFSCGDADALQEVFQEAGFRNVRIEEASFTAEFPDADRFIALAVMAGAAVIPEMSQEGPEAHAALVDAVTRASADTIRRHQSGDRLRFPMHTWIVTAMSP